MLTKESGGDWYTNTRSIEHWLENVVCFLLFCYLVGTSWMPSLGIYFLIIYFVHAFSWFGRWRCTQKMLSSRMMIYYWVLIKDQNNFMTSWVNEWEGVILELCHGLPLPDGPSLMSPRARRFFPSLAVPTGGAALLPLLIGFFLQPPAHQCSGNSPNRASAYNTSQ